MSSIKVHSTDYRGLAMIYSCVKDVRKSFTFRNFDPRSPAGPSAPPAWHRCPVGWSPAAVRASLSAGEKKIKQLIMIRV